MANPTHNNSNSGPLQSVTTVTYSDSNSWPQEGMVNMTYDHKTNNQSNSCPLACWFLTCYIPHISLLVDTSKTFTVLPLATASISSATGFQDSVSTLLSCSGSFTVEHIVEISAWRCSTSGSFHTLTWQQIWRKSCKNSPSFIIYKERLRIWSSHLLTFRIWYNHLWVTQSEYSV